jgi:hypothetical protein
MPKNIKTAQRPPQSFDVNTHILILLSAIKAQSKHKDKNVMKRTVRICKELLL